MTRHCSSVYPNHQTKLHWPWFGSFTAVRWPRLLYAARVTTPLASSMAAGFAVDLAPHENDLNGGTR